jgi:nitrogen regulatory protein PII
MHMLMFVLDDPNKLDAVLETWESLGVSGVTIVESTGIARHQGYVGAPFMAGINRLIQSDQEGHYTLFTIVKSENTVRKCIAAVEALVGNLKEPNTGVMAAWPIAIVKGVPDPALDTETR